MSAIKEKSKVGVMPLGISIALLLTVWLSWNLYSENKSIFLAGETSYGHYQITLSCNSCHGEAFSDPSTMQKACENCHLKALEKVNDSHPRSVFDDPRNQEMNAKLDATQCVTCHREHQPEITRQYGVTLAKDFCIECHQNIGAEKSNHQQLKFDTCANSGCHNYHDNSMLYKKFLQKHLTEPPLLENPRHFVRNSLLKWQRKKKNKIRTDIEIEHQIQILNQKLSRKEEGYALLANTYTPGQLKEVFNEWKGSVHALTATDCASCHQQELVTVAEQVAVCEKCHKKIASAFKSGHHGMKLAIGEQTILPKQARLKVKGNNNPSCLTCHSAHRSNLKYAAIDACLQCHVDQHSKNYKKSKHYSRWLKDLPQTVSSGAGVTCAGCHLPRIKKGKWIHVEHNQNHNLRPAIKMLRSVCMQCHGLDFSLAALSNEKLRQNNFLGQPLMPHPTTTMLKEKNSLSQHNSNPRSNSQ